MGCSIDCTNCPRLLRCKGLSQRIGKQDENRPRECASPPHKERIPTLKYYSSSLASDRTDTSQEAVVVNNGLRLSSVEC